MPCLPALRINACVGFPQDWNIQVVTITNPINGIPSNTARNIGAPVSIITASFMKIEIINGAKIDNTIDKATEIPIIN